MPSCARYPVPTCAAQPTLGGSERHQACPGLLSRPVNYSCRGCLLPRASPIHPGLPNTTSPQERLRGRGFAGSQARPQSRSALHHPSPPRREQSWRVQHGRLRPFAPDLENGPHARNDKSREPPVLVYQGGTRMHQTKCLTLSQPSLPLVIPAQTSWPSQATWLVPPCPHGRVLELQDLIPTLVPTEKLAGHLHGLRASLCFRPGLQTAVPRFLLAYLRGARLASQTRSEMPPSPPASPAQQDWGWGVGCVHPSRR